MTKPLAPVALFVYNRLAHTEQTLRHLLRNTLAHATDLYVFSDGGKDAASCRQVEALRRQLRALKEENATTRALKSITLIERPENFYLERNIIEGIAYVLDRHDRIIVLEDDICTAPHYLEYMNAALDLYADEPRVMHITGFTHLDLLGEHPQLLPPRSETYFTRHAAGWGWGTWRDCWHHHFRHYTSRREALEGLSAADIDTLEYGGAFPCLHSLDRTPIPWDVCWEIGLFRAGGLTLAPAHTLVRNIGLNGGTHFGSASPLLQRFVYDRPPIDRPIALSRAVPQIDPAVEQLFAETIRDWGIRYTLLGRVARWIYRRWKRKPRRQ